MTRPRDAGPIQKHPRALRGVDHSPDDRRHAHPADEPGMDETRRSERHHHHKR